MKRTITIGLVCALLGFSLGATGSARAGILEDFWNVLKKPFSPPTLEENTPEVKKKETKPSEPSAPLYKPAIEYEEAVIKAVETAQGSVVSIVIKKDVPIIEQCPYNPYGNLPPEFRPFFDDDFGVFYRPCQKGTEKKEIGGGSGFIVSDGGLIVTNKHVVRDENAEYVVYTNNGKNYTAKVMDRDPAQDIAILKINATGLKSAKLGNSDSIKLGQSAIAIGNALGEFRNTVSVGVISGLARDITALGGDFVERIEGVIQTDSAINQGNSGGPLLNLKGEVIGVNTAVAEGAENIGFAIPINQVKRAIQSVKTTGSIKIPYLGVRSIQINPDFAAKQKLPVEYGSLIRGDSEGSGVIPGSPAEKAGLQAEDVVLEVNGAKVRDKSLFNLIQQYQIGETVNLKVQRKDKILTFKVKLEERPKS